MTQNIYCEYCGTKASTTADLTSKPCLRYPNGANKGHHSKYKGTEKSQYICKFCGAKSTSIADLTSETCYRHPKGPNMGFHAPAL
jgi:hypothetical protein